MADPSISRRNAGGHTFRALLLGAVLSAAICVSAPHRLWIMASSELTWSYMPVAVIFPFFLIVTVLNVALKLIDVRHALRPAELTIIISMGLVGTSIPIFLVGFFLALIASPYYYASSENQWSHYVHPHLVKWMVPSDEGHAMSWFFEGLPPGERLPWESWVLPLFWWLSLIFAFHFEGIGTSFLVDLIWFPGQGHAILNA